MAAGDGMLSSIFLNVVPIAGRMHCTDTLKYITAIGIGTRNPLRIFSKNDAEAPVDVYVPGRSIFNMLDQSHSFRIKRANRYTNKPGGRYSLFINDMDSMKQDINSIVCRIDKSLQCQCMAVVFKAGKDSRRLSIIFLLNRFLQ